MVFRVYLLFNHFTELSVVQLIVSARIKFAERHFDLVISEVRANGHEFLKKNDFILEHLRNVCFLSYHCTSCYNTILAKPNNSVNED